MPKQVKIGNKHIRVGDKVRSTGRASENGICNNDWIFTVYTITHDDDILIGLYSTRRVKGWADLDGQVPRRQGFWASVDCIIDNFELIRNDHVINGDVTFRGKQLNGMRCKVLHIDKRSHDAFVEVEKDVGGGSADGNGRSGHCVVVPSDRLVKDNNYKISAGKWMEEKH